MAWFALVIYLVGVATAFGLRGWLHYRATGDSGHRWRRPGFGNGEWWAQVLFVGALVLGLVSPVLAATGGARPLDWLDHPAVALAGLLVAVVGFGGVVAAQHAMGRSWRAGIDPAERTDLVTGGVFGWVRNPVFTAMLVASAGLTAMVPSMLQLLALACLLVGVELQVRMVEEPYLHRVHGPAYSTYTERVGRFLPTGRSLPRR